jgi:hypothetical protein
MSLINILILYSIFCGYVFGTEKFRPLNTSPLPSSPVTIDEQIESSHEQPSNQTPSPQRMENISSQKKCCYLCPSHCRAYRHRTWYADVWACTKFPCSTFPEEDDDAEECCCLCRAVIMPIAIGLTCLCDCCILFNNERGNEN